MSVLIISKYIQIGAKGVSIHINAKVVEEASFRLFIKTLLVALPLFVCACVCACVCSHWLTFISMQHENNFAALKVV